MNKVYKTVWNKALGAFVAASEISRSRGRGAGVAVGALVLASSVCGSPAFAQYAAGLGNATGTGSIAIGGNEPGFSPNATAAAAVAIGRRANATNNGAVAVGENATASSVNALAIGTGTSALGVNAIAMGLNSFANFQNAISIGTLSRATDTSAIAVGEQANASVRGAVAVGVASNASGLFSSAYGIGANASNLSALSLGDNAAASGIRSTAQGNFASATAPASIAIGSWIDRNGSGYAFNSTPDAGEATVATQQGNIALGGAAQATGAFGAMALGREALASGSGAIAIGPTVAGIDANRTQATAQGAMAIGVRAQSFGGNGIAHGVNALVGPAALNGIAIGTGATATGTSAISIGTGNVVSGNSSGAIGDPNTISGSGSYALGNNNTITGNNSFVVGNNVTVGNNNNVVLGNASADKAAVQVSNTVINGTTYNFAGTASGAVSVGAAGAERQIVNVAPGALSGTSTDAVNGSQLFATNTAVNTLGTTLTNINNGAGIKYFRSNSVLADSTATGTDSVAVGPTASATATDAMALGHGAVAGTANSVALGAGSTTAAAVATTGATINGTAYTFAGGAPTGVVSVGTAAAKRQLTNVAAGQVSAASTDAVNGSQLFATNTAVNSLGTTVNNINNGAGIKYFHANSALADASATGANSIAVGPLASSSGINSIAVGPAAVASATNAVALGNAANASTPDSVALGTSSTTAAAVATTGATINGTAYNFAGGAPTGVVSVGSAAAKRQLTNVAAGQVSATSTDAVNGSQLFATNTELGNVGNTLTTIAGNTSAAYITLNGSGVKYVRTNDTGLPAADSHATVAGATALGYNATASHNQSVAIGRNSLADGSTLGNVAFAPTGGTYAVAGTTPVGEVSFGTSGAQRRLSNVAAGANDTDAVNVSQLKAVDSKIATLASNAVSYDSPAKGTVTLGGPTSTDGGVTNGTTITNVHQGSTAAGSTDAVNGTQINTLGTSIANNLGGGSVYNSTTGTVTAPSYNLTTVTPGGTTTVNNYTDVGSALTGVSTSVTNVNSRVDNIANGGGIKYFHANSTAADSSATGADSVAVGPRSVASNTSAIAMGNDAQASGVNAIAIGTGARVTGNNSGAFGDPNVVNANNAYAFGNNNTINAGADNSFVMGNNVTVNNANNVVLGNASADKAAVQVSSGTVNGVNYNYAGTASGVLSVGAAGAERQVVNVAPGAVSATSTDAINGSQLYATNQAVAAVANGGAGTVQYSNPGTPTTPNGGVASQDLTLVGATPGAPVTLHNVADGTTGTDAANVGQLNNAVTGLNNKIQNLGNRVEQVSQDANAGTAGAMAMAGMPQAFLPGKSMLSAGVAGYEGEAAVAIGVSKLSDNGRWVVKFGGSANTRGKVGVSAGVGFHW